MDAKGFAAYLNDHLGGSEAACKVTDRLIEQHADDEIGAFSRPFREQLEQERDVVRSMLERLNADEGLLQRGVGLLGGMAMRVRDTLPIGDSPSLIEELESLAVGVWAKRLLWGTVARVAFVDQRFADVPVDALAAQAEEQERALLALRGDVIERALRVEDAA